MRSTAVMSVLLLSASAFSSAEAQQYVISTYAGGAPCPTPTLGVDAPFLAGFGVAVDAAGNVYFPSLYSVYKLDRNGALTRVAGNSKAGYSGDGGPATSAQLSSQWGVAVDNAGNLFIADGSRIRRVSPGGIITTVAGNGTNGFSGDGGPAVDAQLNGAVAVTVDTEGSLFIADYVNNRIRKVTKQGIITTVAGNGVAGYSGDGGPAVRASLAQITGVAVDGTGNLFIASFDVVRKVTPDGIITSVAGVGNPSQGVGLGDGGPAARAEVHPWGVAVDSAGNLFIAEYAARRVRKVAPNGTISTVAGGGNTGDGGPASSAQLSGPAALAVDSVGNLFISDGRIRKVSPGGIITTVSGGGAGIGCFSGDGGPASSAQLSPAGGVAVDAAGNLFIADTGNLRIRKVSADGIITTVAGNGTLGFSGDGGPATSAQLSRPVGVAVDNRGNLFISDYARIRKVSGDGIITTVAGTGVLGVSGDGGPATSAEVIPGALAVDSAGNVYIAAGSVRKISPAGTITRVAGDGAACDFDCVPLGDGGPATSAALYATGVAVDVAGNLFIADPANSRVRKVSPDGIITTIVEKDGVPCQVAVDAEENLFIAGCWPGGMRKATQNGMVTIIAAAGSSSFGDNVPALSTQLSNVTGVTVDGAGNVYAADSVNGAVRVLRPTNRSILVGAVVDAASQRLDPVSPGKIVVIYGVGLGPPQLIQNQPSIGQSSNGQFGTRVGGTAVSFNGIAAPILYTSATQVAAVVPYALSGTRAEVIVTYQGEDSAPFTIPIVLAAPGIFTSNQLGAGQAAAINAADGGLNTAGSPVKIGGYISLYATGEGQTSPAGVDGKVDSSTARPILPVTATIDGIPALVQYAGGVPGQVAGLMQVNVQIPEGVQPGGYVPVVLQVGNMSTTPGAVWIAVER